MIRYCAMLLLMVFNIFWVVVSVTTSIDMTLIGHIRGWRRIRYATWLGGFVSKERKEHDLLLDHTTHPQVLIFYQYALCY